MTHTINTAKEKSEARRVSHLDHRKVTRTKIHLEQ